MKYNVGDIVSFNTNDGQIPDFTADRKYGCDPRKVSVSYHPDNKVLIKARNLSYPWDYLCEYRDTKGNVGILAFKESGLKDYIGNHSELSSKPSSSFNGDRLNRSYEMPWTSYIPDSYNNVRRDVHFTNEIIQVIDDNEDHKCQYLIEFTNKLGKQENLWVNEEFFKGCIEVNNSVNNKSKTKTNEYLQRDDLERRETTEKRGLGSTSSRSKILIRSYPSPRAEELGKHRKTSY